MQQTDAHPKFIQYYLVALRRHPGLRASCAAFLPGSTGSGISWDSPRSMRIDDTSQAVDLQGKKFSMPYQEVSRQ
jgi:hypothetical protein